MLQGGGMWSISEGFPVWGVLQRLNVHLKSGFLTNWRCHAASVSCPSTWILILEFWVFVKQIPGNTSLSTRWKAQRKALSWDTTAGFWLSSGKKLLLICWESCQQSCIMLSTLIIWRWYVSEVQFHRCFPWLSPRSHLCICCYFTAALALFTCKIFTGI